jgi:heme-degrading monooxygenase HmoA
MAPGNWGYLIVWDFRVPREKQPRFEEVYGPDGTWVQLFRRGEGYLESQLVQDLQQRGRYLTLDFWASRSAHERFREQNLAEYEAIDEQCEQLTEAEIKVGEFERVSGVK